MKKLLLLLGLLPLCLVALTSCSDDGGKNDPDSQQNGEFGGAQPGDHEVEFPWGNK